MCNVISTHIYTHTQKKTGMIVTVTYHGGDEIQNTRHDEQCPRAQAELMPAEPHLGVPCLGEVVGFIYRLPPGGHRDKFIKLHSERFPSVPLLLYKI